MQPIEIKQ